MVAKLLGVAWRFACRGQLNGYFLLRFGSAQRRNGPPRFPSDTFAGRKPHWSNIRRCETAAASLVIDVFGGAD
jgi:hypothetical protein